MSKNKSRPDESLFFRMSYSFDHTENRNWWYVVKDEMEDISAYKSNHRNQIKKGLKSCVIKEIDELSYVNEIYNVYVKNMLAYGSDIITLEEFRKTLMREKNNFIPVEYFGAFVNSELVGYSRNLISEALMLVFFDQINILSNYRKSYISYALIHKMNEHYLNSNNFKYVCDGSRNLLHDSGIQDFLIRKFLFRRAYCNLKLIYSNKLRFLISLTWPFRSIIFKSKSTRLIKLKTLLLQHKIYLTQIV